MSFVREKMENKERVILGIILIFRLWQMETLFKFQVLPWLAPRLNQLIEEVLQWNPEVVGNFSL